MSRNAILASLCLLVLAACAKPTPYQAATDGYGFTQQRIEQNRYRINFSGNSLTPLPVVEDYMLYRAAEITIDHGYDYFDISDKDIDKSTRYYATFNGPIGGFYGRGFPRYGYGYGFGAGFGTGNLRPIESYTTSANVVMFKGQKPADDPDAYDAKDVIQRLGPTIRRPLPPQG